ncbi:hypothetical protein HRG_002007 [Hirsutella rhossiliensis]|uniref:Uncharacterized protein n=1 Tax=Hirsutella rhossiliensis TaxID=111463 RepID=A0A9P8N2S1_9HYPO|nr:uncharacterized protein HRG_02007 [Hirsutella rhossiliensis]KAH0966598.1 hypothetical protein HRG_02007 [Hirsutella rhossiliensis]
MKKQRDAISPPLTQAKQDLKAAKDSMPQDVKDKIKAAQTKVKDTFNGLPQDQKDKLKDMNKQIRDAKKSAGPAPPLAQAPAPAPPK